MAMSKSQCRGKLYNIKAIVEGLVKMLEADIIQPAQARSALVKSVESEFFQQPTENEVNGETPPE